MIDSALCRRYCEVLDDEQNEHESMLCMEQQREGEGKRERECARAREREEARGAAEKYMAKYMAKGNMPVAVLRLVLGPM